MSAPDVPEPSSPTLPCNTEVEAALLAALLRDNRSYDKISDVLDASCFFSKAHQRIFSLIKTTLEAGQEAHPATLRHILDKDETLSSLGGGRYLTEIGTHFVTVINVADYARVLHDLHLKRSLISLGEGVVNDAYDPSSSSAEEQIENAESQLYHLASYGQLDSQVVPLDRALAQAMESNEQAFKRSDYIVGVTTGFKDIDGMLGGMHRSDLLILAGRPGMGKTALAVNIAFNAAKSYRSWVNEEGKTMEEGAKVLYFSLEMSAEELANRVLSSQSRVSGDKMRRGVINQEEFNALVRTTHELTQMPLYIDDTPALTVSGLRQRARRIKRQYGLHLVVIDYLQLLYATRRSENRVQEVSEITRALKFLAKELHIPVLALSQLSRQVEAREDKRPQLSDLRESGSIEQDSDVVAFIYRPEYYLRRDPPEQRVSEREDDFLMRQSEHQKHLDRVRNLAEIIIAKQRHGPIGTPELLFEGEFTHFRNLDTVHTA